MVMSKILFCISLILNILIVMHQARSFIKGIKNHNSYYGCEKCSQKGVTIDGCVRLLEIIVLYAVLKIFCYFLKKSTMQLKLL